jgi:hypothetical protein
MTGPDPADPQPEAPAPEASGGRRAMIGLAFLAGGLAMIFIGWVWGRASAIDGAFAGAVIVVGVSGTAAGALMLGRMLLGRR